MDALDIEAAPPPTDQELAKISTYAARQIALEADIAALETQLESTKRQHRIVSEYDLPNAMRDVGTTAYTLLDGSKVELVMLVRAALPRVGLDGEPAEKRDDDAVPDPKALAYLKRLGWGDLIKTIVAVQFSTGEGQKVQQLLDALAEDFPNQIHTEKEGVHAGTLAAAVKGFLRAQALLPPDQRENLDEDLLGVHRQRFCKITPPKTRRDKDAI